MAVLSGERIVAHGPFVYNRAIEYIYQNFPKTVVYMIIIDQRNQGIMKSR